MAPDSFDAKWMSNWSEWVLDLGLPLLPEAVAVGDSVPVAFWAGPRFGVVMHLQWRWSEEHDDDYLTTEIELFRRSLGGWEAASAHGGVSWPNARLVRLDLPSHHAAVWGTTFARGQEWSCLAVEGVVGVEAKVVEVDDADGVARRPLDSPVGAFIVCTDGSWQATLRVFDGAGAVLLDTQFGDRCSS